LISPRLATYMNSTKVIDGDRSRHRRKKLLDVFAKFAKFVSTRCRTQTSSSGKYKELKILRLAVLSRGSAKLCKLRGEADRVFCTGLIG
jgi:hypothetical protein